MKRIAVVVVVAGIVLAGCAGLSLDASGGGGGPQPLAGCMEHGACKRSTQ